MNINIEIHQLNEIYLYENLLKENQLLLFHFIHYMTLLLYNWTNKKKTATIT